MNRTMKMGIMYHGQFCTHLNLVTWYVNKELFPAYFTAADIDMEISRLSSQFGSTPRIYRLNETRGFPKAVIATFGGVELQPLKPNDLAVLAQGKSPHIAILIDFLNNFHQSAKANLPIYKLSGSEGFAGSQITTDRVKARSAFSLPTPPK